MSEIIVNADMIKGGTKIGKTFPADRVIKLTGKKFKVKKIIRSKPRITHYTIICDGKELKIQKRFVTLLN